MGGTVGPWSLVGFMFPVASYLSLTENLDCDRLSQRLVLEAPRYPLNRIFFSYNVKRLTGVFLV